MQQILTRAAERSALAELLDGLDAIEDAEVLAPIVAGARARGVADAFEMARIAAVLVDGTGAILHVGKLAEPLLGRELNVVSRHLVADSAKANRALERLIAAAVAGEGDLPAILVERSGRPPC
jgi:hypothetical protein